MYTQRIIGLLGHRKRSCNRKRSYTNFLAPFIYSRTSCANRAQLATAWSIRDTCTVCGHPTMSNCFTMYSNKIVGVPVLAFAYHSGYHCYSYYLSDYKLGVHVYCLWPPHYYTLGVHVYCLWPPHYYKLGTPTLIIVYTASIHYYYLDPSVYSQRRGDILVCA